MSRPHTSHGLSNNNNNTLPPASPSLKKYSSTSSSVPSSPSRGKVRPSSAPGPNTTSLPSPKSASKRSKIDIKDIWGKDGEKGSSNDLLANLGKNYMNEN